MFPQKEAGNQPKDWGDALHLLKEALIQIPQTQKIIVFFDELPWLASPRSGFLSALDYFWNRYISRMKNVILVVCGSAAAWMIHNIIHDKGGFCYRCSETRDVRNVG